jgi:hypothetical protein
MRRQVVHGGEAGAPASKPGGKKGGLHWTMSISSLSAYAARLAIILFAVVSGLCLAPQQARAAGSALSDKPIPMATEDELPSRTPPLIEIGPDFLGTGNLPKGIELPTGAVWVPALWIFGSYRTAYNYFDNGSGPAKSEWANRLDLFANLRLTGTERILFGMSPISRAGHLTGYQFEPGRGDGWVEDFNTRVTQFFFEGELSELFPNLDPNDRGGYDLGITLGREPIFFQEGMMVNDTMDVFTVTRDQIFIPGLSVDTRVTGLFGWHEVNRDNNREDDGAYLYGIFAEGDWGASTVQIDLAYVDSKADGFYFGAGATQRIPVFGYVINTDFRVNTSLAVNGANKTRVDDGVLLFSQLSTTPHGADNVFYLDSFLGIGHYSSAARDDAAGGPLGRTGILFAAVGLGNYGSALSNRADEVVGSALGYQMFFNNERTQVILELGGLLGTDKNTRDQAAFGARFEQAIGDRYILRVDGFVSMQENRDEGAGGRVEFITQF